MSKLLESSYKKELNLEDAYYTIHWSPYHKVDKFDILKRVPEFSGIFVIFTRKSSMLIPFYLGYSCVGSLRHDIKYLLDESAPVDKEIPEELNKKESYYKFLLVENYQDIEDIFDYYKYYYEQKNIKHIQRSSNKNSGRYANVFVKEYEKDV